MQKSWVSFGRILRLKSYWGGEKGALFSVFLDWCYGHKGLCTPFLVQGGKYGLSTPSSPTFAWSLAPGGDVEGGRESASGTRTAGWEKVGCPGALSGSQCPQKPRHPPSAPHQVLPPHSQFSVTLGSFQGQTMDFTSPMRSGLLPPALPKFQPYPVMFQGLRIYRHLSEVQKAGPRLIFKCLLCIFF